MSSFDQAELTVLHEEMLRVLGRLDEHSLFAAGAHMAMAIDAVERKLRVAREPFLWPDRPPLRR